MWFIIIAIVLVLLTKQKRHAADYTYISPPKIRVRSNTNSPIDVVYTWVDGSDPEWYAIKQQYQPAEDKVASTSISSNADIRWQDFDTLKYSFISLAKYAPWIRNVYVITMNQKPAWIHDPAMQPYMDKVRFVSHDEIIPAKYLPTFSSTAIESFIHCIPSLSEHYIYFNDDTLLGAPVYVSDFFEEKTLKPLVFLQKKCASKKTYAHSNAVLDTIQNAECRSPSLHSPKGRVRTLERLRLQEYPEEVEMVRMNKFRTQQDLHDNYIFSNWWLLYKGYAAESELENVLCSVSDDTTSNKYIYERLLKQRPATFTINDHVETRFVEVRRELIAALDKYYILNEMFSFINAKSHLVQRDSAAI